VGLGTLAVGSDARTSGPMFTAAVTAGLLSVGRDAEQLGLCPTPTVLHHTRLKNRVGGIIVTASHNPEEWNGLKFCDCNGRFLLPGEFGRFREFIERGSFERTGWRALGSSNVYQDAVKEHVRSIVGSPVFAPARQRLKARPLRVGVDAVNGAASVAALELVRALGCEPVPMNCDPDASRSGFPRRPEPTGRNLSDLCRLVRNQHLDAGFAFDPDGDRLGCVSETGSALGEELTICLAAKYVLPHRKGPVVVNLSTTRGVEDVCADFKVPVYRSAVGEASVVERMIESEAVFGGEGNGGVILPELNFTRDGLVGMASVLGLVAFYSKPLSQLAAEVPAYRMVKLALPIDRERFADRRTRLLAEFDGCRVDERDGLWFGDSDYWIHARPSNTEPIVRIVAEGRTEDAVSEVVNRAKRALGERDIANR
ncbi:phosphoglucosamine mutase, partial [candidate division WOR-3 bacterium]|nr:phosphoglucosamine mutase [candidate division WOR-3 bacterium]